MSESQSVRASARPGVRAWSAERGAHASVESDTHLLSAASAGASAPLSRPSLSPWSPLRILSSSSRTECTRIPDEQFSATRSMGNASLSPLVVRARTVRLVVVDASED